MADEMAETYSAVARKFIEWAERKEVGHFRADTEEGVMIGAELLWQSTRLPVVEKGKEADEIEDEVLDAVDLGERFDPIEGRMGAHSLTREDDPGNMMEYAGYLIAEMATGLTKAYAWVKLGLDLYDRGDKDRALKAWRIGYETEGKSLAQGLMGKIDILYNLL